MEKVLFCYSEPIIYHVYFSDMTAVMIMAGPLLVGDSGDNTDFIHKQYLDMGV